MQINVINNFFLSQKEETAEEINTQDNRNQRNVQRRSSAPNFKQSKADQSNIIIEDNLNLSNQNLSSLDQIRIQNLRNVQILDLSKNKLSIWPDQLSVCLVLKKLNLAENQIPEITDSIKNNKLLQQLVLQENSIKKITMQLTTLMYLEELDLSNNLINMIESSIYGVHHLKSLNIAANVFYCLPQNMIKIINKLEVFTLDWFRYLTPKQDTTQMMKPEIKSKLIQLLQSNNLVSIDIFMDFFNKGKQNTILFDSLIQAILNEDLGIINYIIKKVPDYLNVITLQVSPLSLAYKQKKLKATLLLQELGANPTIGLCGKVSLIEYSVLQMDYQFLLKILRHDQITSNMLLYSQEKNQLILSKPLLNIVFAQFNKSYQSNQIVYLLLNKGIQLSQRDKDGYNCVHIAAKFEQLDAIKFAVTYNNQMIKQHLPIVRKSFKQQNFKEENILFKINQKGGPELSTPLHYAAQYGYGKIAQILMEESKSLLNIYKYNKEGQLPKSYATFNGVIYKLIYKQEKKLYKYSKKYYVQPAKQELNQHQYQIYSRFLLSISDIQYEALDLIKSILNAQPCIHQIVILFKILTGKDLIFSQNIKELYTNYQIQFLNNVQTTMNTEMSNIIPKEEKDFLVPISQSQHQKSTMFANQLEKIIVDNSEIRISNENKFSVMMLEIEKQMKYNKILETFNNVYATKYAESLQRNLNSFILSYTTKHLLQFYFPNQRKLYCKTQEKIKIKRLLQTNILIQFEFFHMKQESILKLLAIKQQQGGRSSSEQQKSSNNVKNDISKLFDTKLSSQIAIKTKINISIMQKPMQMQLVENESLVNQTRISQEIRGSVSRKRSSIFQK